LHHNQCCERNVLWAYNPAYLRTRLVLCITGVLELDLTWQFFYQRGRRADLACSRSRARYEFHKGTATIEAALSESCIQKGPLWNFENGFLALRDPALDPAIATQDQAPPPPTHTHTHTTFNTSTTTTTSTSATITTTS
jgi:hypothetical protein